MIACMHNSLGCVMCVHLNVKVFVRNLHFTWLYMKCRRTRKNLLRHDECINYKRMLIIIRGVKTFWFECSSTSDSISVLLYYLIKQT